MKEESFSFGTNVDGDDLGCCEAKSKWGLDHRFAKQQDKQGQVRVSASGWLYSLVDIVVVIIIIFLLILFLFALFF